jgi:hypothetical protein
MSCNNSNLVDGYGLGPLGTGCPCDSNQINSKYTVAMAPLSQSDRARFVRDVKMQSVKMAMANAGTPKPPCRINTGNQIGVL